MAVHTPTHTPTHTHTFFLCPSISIIHISCRSTTKGCCQRMPSCAAYELDNIWPHMCQPCVHVCMCACMCVCICISLHVDKCSFVQLRCQQAFHNNFNNLFTQTWIVGSLAEPDVNIKCTSTGPEPRLVPLPLFFKSHSNVPSFRFFLFSFSQFHAVLNVKL